MTTHSHDIDFQWPYEDAENTVCFTCSHVLEEQHPVLRVTHDEDGGAWQFLWNPSVTKMLANHTLVPTRNGEAPLLAAHRGRWAS